MVQISSWMAGQGEVTHISLTSQASPFGGGKGMFIRWVAIGEIFAVSFILYRTLLLFGSQVSLRFIKYFTSLTKAS